MQKNAAVSLSFSLSGFPGSSFFFEAYDCSPSLKLWDLSADGVFQNYTPSLVQGGKSPQQKQFWR